MEEGATLGELLQGVEYRILRGGRQALDRRVVGVCDDSRVVRKGELFIALGQESVAQSHVLQALERGCRILALRVGMRPPSPLPPATIVVQLPDVRAALASLAAKQYGQPARHLTLIGITGTNGKTTTAYLIAGALHEAGYRTGLIGTVSSRYHDAKGRLVEEAASHTTPAPMRLHQLLQAMVREGVTHVVMEVSSHALDQERVAGLLFDVAVFTNLSRDHLDYHADWERYYVSKELLCTRHLRPGGTVVLIAGDRTYNPELPPQERCWRDRLARNLLQQGFVSWPRRDGRGRLLLCGEHGATFLKVCGGTQDMQGQRCLLRAGGGSAQLQSTLVGRHNLENLLCAAGALQACGLTLPQAAQGLAAVQQVPGRLDRVRLPEMQEPMAAAAVPAVFVDYAHSPDALTHILTTLRELPHRRLICLFGCGGDRDRGKRPLMGEAAGRLADLVVLTSDNPRGEAPEDILRQVEEGLALAGRQRVAPEVLFGASPPGYTVEADRRKAIRLAVGLAAVDDIVVLAGKGHECGQVIDGVVRPFDDRLEAVSALAQWRLDRVVAATGGRCAQEAKVLLPCARIVTDSRALQPGDVFVALRGERFDGHDFLADALRMGARAVVAEVLPPGAPDAGATVLVPDTLAALGDLAAYRRRLLAGGVRRIAITGSSGKTTVKEMCAAICAHALGRTRTNLDRVLKTQGNFNNLIGLPLTLLQLEPWHRIAVLEMGMNRPGEIARLTEIADPDIACINNVQPAHLQGLGSIDGVAAAKGELFQGLNPEAVLVVNLDDSHVRRLASGLSQRRLTCALDGARRARADVRADRLVSLGAAGSRFTLHIGGWHQRISLPVPGLHNVRNALIAAGLATAAGIPVEAVAAALAAYQPVDKRMQSVRLAAGPIVINDAYNANPASMRAALETVAAFGSGRKAALLGDMLELGAGAAVAHREIGTLTARLGYDYLAALGDFADEITAAAAGQGMTAGQLCCCRDHADMAQWVTNLLRTDRLTAGDWILLKGSRGMRMETLLPHLAPASASHCP